MRMGLNVSVCADDSMDGLISVILAHWLAKSVYKAAGMALTCRNGKRIELPCNPIRKIGEVSSG